MNYSYSYIAFNFHFSDEIIDMYMDKENIDEWGVATITIDGLYGAEYNICIEDGNNESAIYFQELDENNFWQTDFSNYKHYEIDFNNPNWNEDLKKEMKEYLLKELKENKDIYPL